MDARVPREYYAVIVGAGILGTSIAYFLKALNPSREVAVIEQEPVAAFHTSGRNTGKVHAPYLYDPDSKGLFARAAFLGFSMWEEYARLRGLPFRRDGVTEVALDEAGAGTLERHLGWGIRNGLGEGDIEVVDGRQLREHEPNVECAAALRCGRDASTDYAACTRALAADAEAAGARFVMRTRAVGVSFGGGRWRVSLAGGHEAAAGFLINAAGGEAIDVAHAAGAAADLTDVHFRGEYWRAPDAYRGLTRTSVYSVPDFPEYPFLDPHWIVRADGSCEIGPNAVPVFSPYGYGAAENARRLVPKAIEMLRSGARRALLDRRFQGLAAAEARSSLSRSAMVARVRRFLPAVDASRITERGAAGIRSSVIDSAGRFVPDAVLRDGPSSLHVLNYNSPGATGALPFAAHLVAGLAADGRLPAEAGDARCGPWRFSEVAAGMAR